MPKRARKSRGEEEESVPVIFTNNRLMIILTVRMTMIRLDHHHVRRKGLW